MTDAIKVDDLPLQWSSRRPVVRSAAEVVPPLLIALEAVRDEAVQAFMTASGYDAGDVQALWRDQYSYIQGLPQEYARLMQPMVTSERGIVRRVSKGRMLVVLPSNAPIPLVGILGAAAVITGSRVAFTSPRGVKDTVQAILAAFDADDSIALIDGSPRDVLANYSAAFDHVYFMGPSSAYPQVAAMCATSGVSLAFEGQGFGAAIVSASLDRDIVQAVRALLRSKQFCLGRMCSAPNSILVQQSIFADFVEAWHQEASHFQLPVPVHETLRDGTFAKLSASGVVVGASSKDWSNAHVPLLVATSSFADSLISEFFSPVAWVGEFSDIHNAVDMANSSRYRLQVSYFGTSIDEYDEVQRMRFSRTCLNMVPSYQDATLPWGNAGLSGYSRVETFLEKMLEPVLVEGLL